MLIKYANNQNETTIVKIYLHEDSELIEFDVFFARLDSTLNNHGMDVTINWKNLDIDNRGIFCTDANSFKFVKRNIHALANYSHGKAQSPFSVPSYFYPVTSGIYIEDDRER